ncbi:MAG TPA: 50S ribosomal protein L18 [Candidatus Korarchaeota archaeon]|nr:50S ribosomal protein L18 [Candidatus Korarchaeota archaeon]
MARSGRYKVKFRRRREGKTDYRKRLALLKSGLPRLVVRRTNRHIIVQVMEYVPNGDRVLAYAFSKELRKFGWEYSLKSTPAAYLTGYLAALRAKKAGVERAVLDLGRQASTPGSKLYAALKGALDAGLEVPHGEEILPNESRIRGEHIASWAATLREENPEFYERQFSDYIRRGVDPTTIPEVFEQVLERIKQLNGVEPEGGALKVGEEGAS